MWYDVLMYGSGFIIAYVCYNKNNKKVKAQLTFNSSPHLIVAFLDKTLCDVYWDLPTRLLLNVESVTIHAFQK